MINLEAFVKFFKGTNKERLIMALLADGDNAEQYGLSLMKASQGKLKRRTIYIYLARLEEKGLIESRKEEREPKARGLPRRLYKLTSSGIDRYSQE